MHLLDVLARFYSEAVPNRFLLLAVVWILWPGLLFAVGVIFESREIPLINKQSRAFFPGELSFGVAIIGIISAYAKTGISIPVVNSPYWWLTLAAVVFLVGWRWRQSDTIKYPKRARNSPTKVLHDFVGYFLAPVLLIGLSIPQICMLDTEGIFDKTRESWFVIALCLVFYLFSIALDIINYTDSGDLYARYPHDWKPIWKTRKK